MLGAKPFNPYCIMYRDNQREIVKSMGNWLGGMPWDVFSTITYRYDIKAEQNRKIMTDLEKYLKSLDKPFNMFWVTEFTNYNYNTHNHLLVKGNIVRDINLHTCAILLTFSTGNRFSGQHFSILGKQTYTSCLGKGSALSFTLA